MILNDDFNNFYQSFFDTNNQYRIKSILSSSFFASIDTDYFSPDINFGLFETEKKIVNIDLTKERKYFFYIFNNNKEYLPDYMNSYCKIESVFVSNYIQSNIISQSNFLIIFFSNKAKQDIEVFLTAIKYGTIPIFVDTRIKLPFSDFINWDKFILNFSREDFIKLCNKNLTIDNNILLNKRIKLKMIYEAYFMSKTNQLKTIISFFYEKNNISLNDFQIKHFSEYFSLAQNKNLFSIELKRKYLFNSSFIRWNVIFYPFFSFESFPSIDFYISKENIFYLDFKISEERNVEFHAKNDKTEKSEEFTIVILSFDREEYVSDIIKYYLENIPFLNSIIVIWNSINKNPNLNIWKKLDRFIDQKKLRIIKMEKNSLNNRFLPIDIIQTEAILSLDDDIFLEIEKINKAFMVWKKNRSQIVGFPARDFTFNHKNNVFKYKYGSISKYSMILTGAAFYHSFYNFYYTYILDERIKEYIDNNTNCEDIAFNMMVSHLIRKSPILINNKENFVCKTCRKFNRNESISSKKNHYQKRSNCLNYFINYFEYNPLISTKLKVNKK